MRVTVSRKQRRHRNSKKHPRRARTHRKRGGADEPAAAAAPAPAAAPAAPPAASAPYILVECFPDSTAKVLFEPKIREGANLPKKKYYFKIVNIKRANTEKVNIKTTGWFNKEASIGDVSKIELEGQLVMSDHIGLKQGHIDVKIEPIPIKFRFSKNFKQIVLLTPVNGNFENKSYNLSKGMFSNKAPLNYISRPKDMFSGEINKHFLSVLPNPKDTVVETD